MQMRDELGPVVSEGAYGKFATVESVVDMLRELPDDPVCIGGESSDIGVPVFHAAIIAKSLI